MPIAGLEGQHSVSAIELLLGNPTLMENLRKSLMGSYGVILSLLGCLDHGAASKRLVDLVIDNCEYAETNVQVTSNVLTSLRRRSCQFA